MQTDIARIEKWAKIFESPAALLAALTKNVPANVSTIEQDVLKAKNDFATNEYYYAGEDIADILVLAIGPVPVNATSPSLWASNPCTGMT